MKKNSCSLRIYDSYDLIINNLIYATYRDYKKIDEFL